MTIEIEERLLGISSQICQSSVLRVQRFSLSSGTLMTGRLIVGFPFFYFWRSLLLIVFQPRIIFLIGRSLEMESFQWVFLRPSETSMENQSLTSHFFVREVADGGILPLNNLMKRGRPLAKNVSYAWRMNPLIIFFVVLRQTLWNLILSLLNSKCWMRPLKDELWVWSGVVTSKSEKKFYLHHSSLYFLGCLERAKHQSFWQLSSFHEIRHYWFRFLCILFKVHTHLWWCWYFRFSFYSRL